MPHRKYLIRQATSLLRFAKQTRDPDVASVLLAKAADFNEQRNDHPPAKMDVSPRAPDVEPEA
jgi:hypothetical protein